MPNYLGYNPYQDMSGAFSGASEALGTAWLRSQAMRNEVAREQNQLMMEVARLRQQQEMFNARQGLDERQLEQGKSQFEKTFGLSEKQFGLHKTEAENVQSRWQGEAPEREARTANLQAETDARRAALAEVERQAAARVPLKNYLGELGFPAMTPEIQPPGAALFGDAYSIPTDPYLKERLAAQALGETLPADKAVETALKMRAASQNPQLAQMLAMGFREFNTPPQNITSLGGVQLLSNPAVRPPPQREDTLAGMAQWLTVADKLGMTNTIPLVERAARLRLGGTNVPMVRVRNTVDPTVTGMMPATSTLPKGWEIVP